MLRQSIALSMAGALPHQLTVIDGNTHDLFTGYNTAAAAAWIARAIRCGMGKKPRDIRTEAQGIFAVRAIIDLTTGQELLRWR